MHQQKSCYVTLVVGAFALKSSTSYILGQTSQGRKNNIEEGGELKYATMYRMNKAQNHIFHEAMVNYGLHSKNASLCFNCKTTRYWYKKLFGFIINLCTTLTSWHFSVIP